MRASQSPNSSVIKRLNSFFSNAQERDFQIHYEGPYLVDGVSHLSVIVIPCSLGKRFRSEIRNETFPPDEEVKFEDHIGEYRPYILEGRRD